MFSDHWSSLVKMGLLLQLFVVTTFVVVLQAAPLDQNSESTTVGIRPLPAELPKPQASQNSSDSSDLKRESRDTSNEESSSTTEIPSQQNASRPVRDVSEKPQGPPASQQPENKPTEDTRQLRDIEHAPPSPRPSGNPPPPPPSAPVTYQLPLRPEAQNQRSQGPLASASNRPARDTNTPERPRISTLPANIPSKTREAQSPQNNEQNGRQLRDVTSSTTSTERSTN